MKGGIRPGGGISFLCLGAGLACLWLGLCPLYPPAGPVFGAAALILWTAGRRFCWTWAPGLILAACAAAAAGGTLAGAAPGWMLAAFTLALASFELWDAGREEGGSAEPRAAFERRRGLLLAGALAAGFAAALLAARLDFNVPFGGLGLAALAVLFGLYRLNGLFKEQA